MTTFDDNDIPPPAGLGAELADTLDLIDQVVDAITDDQIDGYLQQLLEQRRT